MHKGTITFRLAEQKRKKIDAIAAGVDRDRTYILNEAIDTYLEIHHWQVDHIQEGLKQADKGNFASAKQVKTAFAKWRK